jgi:hypothetical protein
MIQQYSSFVMQVGRDGIKALNGRPSEQKEQIAFVDVKGAIMVQ